MNPTAWYMRPVTDQCATSSTSFDPTTNCLWRRRSTGREIYAVRRFVTSWELLSPRPRSPLDHGGGHARRALSDDAGEINRDQPHSGRSARILAVAGSGHRATSGVANCGRCPSSVLRHAACPPVDAIQPECVASPRDHRRVSFNGEVKPIYLAQVTSSGSDTTRR